jgi:hypothetical protein
MAPGDTPLVTPARTGGQTRAQSRPEKKTADDGPIHDRAATGSVKDGGAPMGGGRPAHTKA